MVRKNKLKEVSLTAGAMYQTIGKLLTNGIAFLTAPIFTRILSSGDYGKVSVYSAWCTLFSFIVGLQVDGTIANAKIRYPEEELPSYLSSVMTIAVFSFATIFSFALLLNNFLAEFINIRKDLIFFLVVQSFASFCVKFYDSILIQFKRTDKSMYFMAFIFVLDTVLALLFLSIFTCEKYISKIYGEGLPLTIIGCFLCIYILIKGKVFYRSEYWNFCLPISLPLILHSTGHLILWQSDRIMIQKLIGESETGIYSIAVLTASVLITIFLAFNNAWVPYYYEYKKRNDIESIILHSKNYMLNISAMHVVFFFVVPELFKILAPYSYWDLGLKVIPILVMTSYFRYLYLFPVNHEIYNRNTNIVAIGTFLAAIFNIFLNFFFIKIFYTIGAAYATCISSLFLFLFHLLIANNFVRNFEYPISLFFKGFVPVLIAFFLYFPMANIFVVRWIIACLISAFFVLRFLKIKTLF